MNENEQQILMAMATANPEQRAMLNRRLVQLRAARRTATVAQHDAALPYEPTAVQMRHTSQTDWIDRIATTERADDEMRREAITEAQEWLSTKSALVRSDAEELHAQASGYARMWAGQFGPQMGIAQEAFLGRIARLTQGATELDYEDLFDEDRANKRHWEHADGKTGEFEESDRLKKQVVRPSNMPADYEEPDTSPWRQGKVGDIVDPTVTTVPIGLPKDPDADFNEGEWAAAGTVDNSVGLPGHALGSHVASIDTAAVSFALEVARATSNDHPGAVFSIAPDSAEGTFGSSPGVLSGIDFKSPDDSGPIGGWMSAETAQAALAAIKADGLRTASLKTADKWRVVPDVGNPGKWVVQKFTDGWGVWGDMGDAVDSQQAAYTKMDSLQSEGSKTAGVYDYPEGSTAICKNCHQPILLDQREGGGSGKDWGSPPEDWVGNGGIGMDYGCSDSPDNDDEGTGGHDPMPGSIHAPGSRLGSKTAAPISDPQHVFTLNPDDEDWIGNFTDDALEENINYWTNDAGKTQPNLPGYDQSMLKYFNEERARRQGSKTAASESDPYVILRVLNTNRTLEQVQAYMYSPWTAQQIEDGTIFISGHDDGGGFGLQAQRDRLLSGLIGTEIWDSAEGGTGAVGGRPVGNVGSLKTAGNPYPVGSSMWFDWDARLQAGERPEGSGPYSSGAPGGGIPLHGPLTPEQQAWLDKRGSKTAADFTPGSINSAEEARDAAIDWQNWMSEQNLSMGEMIYWENYFSELAERFPELAEEFHENAITGSLKTAEDAPPIQLECYGCGLTGSYDVFGLPTRCPNCGSYEIHLPEAGANWEQALKNYDVNGNRISSLTAADDIETWVSTGDDATSGGVPTWVSDAQAEARENGGYPDGYDETTGTYMKTAGSEVRDDEESPDPSIQIGDVLTRNEGEFATVTYVSGNYAELLYPSGFAFRTRLMESGPGQNGTAWHKVSSTTASSDSDDQQAWWDSMDIDTQKRYVTDQHAKYPDTRNPDALAIDLIEIDAAAAADAIMPGRGPGWYEIYAQQLANLGVIRENGYNRLASKTALTVTLSAPGMDDVTNSFEQDDLHNGGVRTYAQDYADNIGQPVTVSVVGTPFGGTVQPSRTASRRTAADDDDGGGMKCSVCGDAIEKNPGEDGYHHDNGEKHDHEAKPDSSKESSRTAGRVEDLIRRMENAPDFGYDDEEVELNEILARDGKTWMWGPGDRVQIIPGLNGVAGAHKMAVRQIPISEVQPGDMLVQGPDSPAMPERDTVESVDSIGGAMFIIDFANGTSTAPMANGLVYVAAQENPPGKQLGEEVVVTDNTHGIGFGWVVDDDGDDIHQDSINEDLGSELKKDAALDMDQATIDAWTALAPGTPIRVGFEEDAANGIFVGLFQNSNPEFYGNAPLVIYEADGGNERSFIPARTEVPRPARIASRTGEWSDQFNKDKGKIEDSTTEVVPITGPPADDTAMFEPSEELDGHWKPSKHQTPVTGQRIQRASALDHSLFE